MDKRTFLFVLALTLVLFGVNIYFENQNQDKLKAWSEQQKAKRTQAAVKLEKEIAKKTISTDELNLVNLYGDKEQNELIATGFKADGNIIVISWSQNLQKNLYATLDSKPVELTLAVDPNAVNQMAFYKSAEKDSQFSGGNLPVIGKYDLQIVNLNKEPKVDLAEFVDGKISFPSDELAQLKAKINDEEPSTSVRTGSALALLKSSQGYLPVGLYDYESGSLIQFGQLDSFKPFLKVIASNDKTPRNGKTEEKFFVIENEYQQLVFSNVGGSLVEINLPFRSEDNQKSVVKEIDFDRQMVKNYPFNAYFPSHPFYTPGENPKDEPVAHAQGKLGGYYPLLRRDLVEPGNRKTVRVPPQYYAANIISDYPEVAELVYELKHFDKTSIVFEAKQPHRKITKTFSIESENKDAPYCINVLVEVEGDSRGLWITSGVPEVEWISGAPAPALKYRITRNNKPEVVLVDLPKESLTVSSIFPDWVCNSNGFLGIIVDPLTEIDAGFRAQYVPGKTVPSRLVDIGLAHGQFKAQDMPGYMMAMPLSTKGGAMSFRFFAGPFAESVLTAVDKVYSNSDTGYNPDYIACQTFHGWFAFISEPFAKFLFILMKFFHSITGSWAFSIVLLTIALRIMLYPLNAWSAKSMIKMQQIAPEVTAIQEKYKKDPKRAQLEVMNLYRDRGVNPVSGCLPILIQMPFLIGMFDLLKSTFELRGASFIPGWIDDLSAPDVLFQWETPLFFIGNQFHLLPILLGLVMFLQQRFSSSAPKDPSLMTDQQRQQRAMGSVMAGVFAIMFYNFPSGLNIYWLSSMLLGMLQQWWTAKTMKPATELKKPIKK